MFLGTWEKFGDPASRRSSKIPRKLSCSPMLDCTCPAMRATRFMASFGKLGRNEKMSVSWFTLNRAAPIGIPGMVLAKVSGKNVANSEPFRSQKNIKRFPGSRSLFFGVAICIPPCTNPPQKPLWPKIQESHPPHSSAFLKRGWGIHSSRSGDCAVSTGERNHRWMSPCRKPMEPEMAMWPCHLRSLSSRASKFRGSPQGGAP